MSKVAKLQEIFSKIDPNGLLAVEDKEDGSHMVYGPFPTFIFLVKEDEPIRALVHVNSDAPNLIYMFNAFSSELDIVFDGPFAVEGDTGRLILGAEAYTKKEDNILMFAQDILNRRVDEGKLVPQDGLMVPGKELYVPEEKKIVIAQ